MHLSVIIPAYNEERRLPKTLKEIDKYLSKKSYDYEIIVVSDGSTDRTVEVVEELIDKIKNLKILDFKENKGKGFGVREGMLKAKGDYRIFTDADNSTSIDHLEKMWPYFEKGYDVVIGSRDSKDAKGARQAVLQPFWKRLLANFGNLIIQLVVVPGIWDTQCGFKGFTKKAAKDLFSRAKMNRWAFDVEILALARKLGYKIAIIPIYWINDPHSKVKIGAYFRFFKEIFQIKLNLIKGIYG